jgi:hypothetical protein
MCEVETVQMLNWDWLRNCPAPMAKDRASEPGW